MADKAHAMINTLAERLDDAATRSLFPVMWGQLKPEMKLKIKDLLMQCLNNTNINTSNAAANNSASSATGGDALSNTSRAARLLGITFAIENWENVLPSLLHAMIKGGNAKFIGTARNANMAIRAIIEELVRTS